MHPGQTRTHIDANHAFIAPDSHLPSPLPGWKNAQVIILISPQMGARLTQFIALMEAGATSGLPLAGVERFAYVLEGQAKLSINETEHQLGVGQYVYLPPDTEHVFASDSPSRMMVFERVYLPLEGVEIPDFVVGDEKDQPSEANEGDPDAQLKRLLPVDDSFDWEINMFTFQPGATLPLVEVHVMEHGLVMLEGQGIYRLDEHWYLIQKDDVIWMGPYCPQWFAAIGKTPSTYLYYKDVRRDPLAELEIL